MQTSRKKSENENSVLIYMDSVMLCERKAFECISGIKKIGRLQIKMKEK